jgi:hypothetical protein
MAYGLLVSAARRCASFHLAQLVEPLAAASAT